MSKTIEMVKLQVFHMPCCGSQICWVNPRLPNYCPECGEQVYMKLKFESMTHCIYRDEKAMLHHSGDVISSVKDRDGNRHLLTGGLYDLASSVGVVKNMIILNVLPLDRTADVLWDLVLESLPEGIDAHYVEGMSKVIDELMITLKNEGRI